MVSPYGGDWALYAGYVGEVARRSRHCGRPGAERSPDSVGRTVDPPRQAVLRPFAVVEHDGAVGVPRSDGAPPVLVAVGQRESHFGAGAEVDRVESFEAGAGGDAVAGGVAQEELEPDGRLGWRREADAPVVVRTEAVSVVVEPVDGLPLRVGALRGGRIDDVAHRVEHACRVGIDLAGLVGLGLRVAPAAGLESHAVGRRGRVVRGVGPAHVERAEEVALEKAAAEGVSRLVEHPLDERGDPKERVVVVRREDPFGRHQVRRAVAPGILVVVDWKEFHG